MTRIKMLPPHFFFILLLALFGILAPTSSQTKKREPPNFRSIPPTTFACDGRTAGYYADPEAECQAYHMCDTQERKYSYLCPGFTLFNQKYMVCDHWHAVNCSTATQYYVLNNRIGQVPEDKKTTVEETNIIGDHTPLKSGKAAPAFKFTQIKPSLPSKRNHLSKHDSPEKITRALPKAGQRFQKTTFSKPTASALTSKTSTMPPNTIKIPSTTADAFSTSAKIHLTTTTEKIPLTTAKTPSTTSKIPSTTTKAPSTIEKVPPTTTKPLINIKTTRKPLDFPTVSFLILPPTKEFSFSPNLVQKDKNHLINARGSSGPRIKFGTIHADDSLEDKSLSGIKFRPLFKKQKKNLKKTLFDKRNFTIPPQILTTTPPSSLEEDETDDSDPQPASKAVEPIITFLVPPIVESPSRSSEEESNSISVSPFLVPPLRGPVVLQGDNQEKRTPLVISNVRPFNSRSLGFLPPQSIIPPRFSFSRPNKDFFIPAPGLLPPFPDNFISDEDESSQSENSLSIPLQMTMTFPNNTITRRRRPLRRNPNCPRCHPAFLKKNQCRPCVIIK